jgi:hypothetical protein
MVKKLTVYVFFARILTDVLFGDGMAIQDQYRLGVGDVVTDVPAQFGADGAIIPESSTNEVLQGSPFEDRLGGDGFGGFAFQAGEFALEDDLAQ